MVNKTLTHLTPSSQFPRISSSILKKVASMFFSIYCSCLTLHQSFRKKFQYPMSSSFCIGNIIMWKVFLLSSHMPIPKQKLQIILALSIINEFFYNEFLISFFMMQRMSMKVSSLGLKLRSVGRELE